MLEENNSLPLKNKTALCDLRTMRLSTILNLLHSCDLSTNENRIDVVWQKCPGAYAYHTCKMSLVLLSQRFTHDFWCGIPWPSVGGAEGSHFYWDSGVGSRSMFSYVDKWNKIAVAKLGLFYVCLYYFFTAGFPRFLMVFVSNTYELPPVQEVGLEISSPMCGQPP